MCPPATERRREGGRAALDLVPGALQAKRLGVYGGSFDPPHAGHLWVAERACEHFGLDHVLFVPARHPPHKLDRKLAPDGDRLALLSLLLTAHPEYSIWCAELRREGPSYSVDTLLELRSGLPETCELFLLLGSDNLAGLATWRRVEDLFDLAQPIVLARRGAALGEGALAGLPEALAERVRAGFIEIETMDVSATEIRADLARGLDADPVFPRALATFARLRGLWRGARER